MQTGLCRMRTESLTAPSLRTGKRISDARDEWLQTASWRCPFRKSRPAWESQADRTATDAA